MDCCVLCLEINKELVNCIKVNSAQWQEHKVQKLIEKHFWPLVAPELNSYLCTLCWKELNNFHNFYLRVEEAHVHFGRRIKTEDGTNLLIDKNEIVHIHSPNEDYHQESSEKEGLIDCHLESEILAENPIPLTVLMEEQILIVKDEPIDIVNTDDIISSPSSKQKTIIKDVKNLQELSNDDPLEKPKKRKSINPKSIKKIKSKKTTKCTKNLKHSKKLQPNNNATGPQIKQDLDSQIEQETILECNKSLDSSTNEDDDDDKRDSNYEPSRNSPIHAKPKRKPKKPNLTRKFPCDECGKSFRDNFNLKNHKITHLPDEEKKYKCGECGKSYGTPFKLEYHKRGVHRREFRQVCYICGLSVRKGDLKVHMDKHEGKPELIMNCDICGQCYGSRKSLNRHKADQHPLGGKEAQYCPICSKIISSKRALQLHIRRTHEGSYKHKCTICGRAFKSKVFCKEHMATHTGDSLYRCPWCPKTTNSSGNMYTHRKKQHPKEFEEAKLKKNAEKFRVPYINRTNVTYYNNESI